MLPALTLLLLLQLVGEVIVQCLALPVPGPVLGLLLLLAWLLWRGRLDEALRHTANTLLQHLSLFFVPAGVGVMVHAGRVADEFLALGVALVASTVLSMAATALTLHFFVRHRARRETK